MSYKYFIRKLQGKPTEYTDLQKIAYGSYKSSLLYFASISP